VRRLADGLHALSPAGFQGFNSYLVDGFLIDPGMRRAASRRLKGLDGHAVRGIVLTHVHPDHGGGCGEICAALGVPVWCGAADADALEAGRHNYARSGAVQRALARRWSGGAHPVARRLREGDRVGSFTVLETPGHTPGHLSLWRESDRTLVAGEVLNNLHNLLPFGRFAPQEPAGFSTAERRRNRASARRLAALEPSLVVFAHGPPMRDTGRFMRYAEALT
jgi:hydroxyacylglutathione hydrolase